MKALLGCLLCLVLTSAQCFAVSGGPDYGKGGTVRTTGIYAGVLYPLETVNSIGLFSVQVPRSGLGVGTVVLFANSSAYSGTMNATADPDSAVFTGFIDAGFNFVDAICTANCTDPDTTKRTVTTLTLRAVASGRIDGKVKATRTLSQTSARLSGTSLIRFNPDFSGVGGRSYELVGFKQAEL